MDPTVIEPVDVQKCSPFMTAHSFEGSAAVKHLGFVKSINRLGRGNIIRIPLGADRRLNTCLFELGTVSKRQILDSLVCIKPNSA